MSFIKKTIGAALLLAASQAMATVTGFYYTSSPTSWVGGGETATILPTTNYGFSFNTSQNFDNGVSISINDLGQNPDFGSQRWWYLDFAAPHNEELHVGHYNATRWPFQAEDSAGLNFSGNGRGDNQLTGFFDILEVSYTNGLLSSFAANFTQYDEMNEQGWNHGQIRIDSSFDLVPEVRPNANVPEPNILALLGLGLFGLTFARRKKHQ